VTAVWRHGDRAPSDGTFPTDKGNGDGTWPQGFGELSQNGMRQHQHLGNYLRQRYVIDQDFLSENYSSKEVYVRSSSYNRTIMSALSNLAGMYPTATGVDMLDSIPLWQPIPVHSQPREIDPLLWMDCPCPEAERLDADVLASKAVKDIEAENADFLELLSNKTGWPNVDLDKVWDVWDPLNCERIHNDTHNWPDWVTEPLFEQLTDLMQLGTTFDFHDPKIQRFRGGPLFNDIAIRMDQKANRPGEIYPPQLKYYVYSAHDMTMAALLENLGAYTDQNAHLPEYASAILFELHEKKPKVFTVETWYINETWTSYPPVRLIVEGCDDQGGECSLENFVKKATSNVPQDWFAECNPVAPPNGTTTSTPTVTPPCDSNQAAIIAAIVLGVTTLVFLLAFIVLLVLYCRLKKRNKISHGQY